MTTHHHDRQVCRCGAVIAQCRCMSPKTDRVVCETCPTCQRATTAKTLKPSMPALRPTEACTFCGRERPEVGHLVLGTFASICGACAQLAVEICAKDSPKTGTLAVEQSDPGTAGPTAADGLQGAAVGADPEGPSAAPVVPKGWRVADGWHVVRAGDRPYTCGHLDDDGEWHCRERNWLEQDEEAGDGGACRLHACELGALARVTTPAAAVGDIDEDAETLALRTLDADAGEAPEGAETDAASRLVVERDAEIARLNQQLDTLATSARLAYNAVPNSLVEDAALEQIYRWVAERDREAEARRAGR